MIPGLAILIPVTVFLLLCRALLHRGDSTREAALRAAVVSVTILVTITETLSLPYLLTRNALIVSWSVALVAVLGFLLRSLKRMPPPPRPPSQPAIHLPSGMASLDVFLCATIVIILAIIGAVAIIAPPNTSDAMEYHLPRIIFWVSNHTVRNYPTPDYAQLIQGPAAEFITLHTYLLFGSDRLVNLVEFFSLTGCAVAVSLIAGKFSTGRTGQLFAGLFVVTIPEAVLESSGAMTTVVVSFWIVTACYFTIRAVKDQRIIDIITVALAIGLAILTKGIALIYLPFLIFGCLLYRPAPRRTWMLKRIALLILIAVTLNTPQFIRAWQVTGTPLGAPFAAGGSRLHFGNDQRTPASIVASVIRHATLHLETPSGAINSHIEAIARRAIRLTGRNPDDPESVWLGYSFYVGHPSRLETQAGNPLHFLLLILTFVALPWVLPKFGRENRSILWYAAGILCAFIGFCAAIRWQPWGSRFHLPLFVVAAAIVGHLIGRLYERRVLIAALSMLLLINAIPYLLSNSIRSILHTKSFPTIDEPRAELYFADQHTALAPDYLALAAAINASHCGSIAIDASLRAPVSQTINSPPTFYIYPLLAQLHINGRDRTVRYINVENSTQRFALPKPAASPCAVVCLSCGRRKPDAALGSTRNFGDAELTLRDLAHE